MSGEGQEILNLDEINSQFMQGKVSKERNTRKEKIVIVILAFFVISFTVAGIGFYKISQKAAKPVSYLSEFGEQLRRIRLDTNYIGLNKTIHIDNKRAYIGMINSEGSDKVIQFRIYDEESGITYYQSEKMQPGSYVDSVMVEEMPKQPDKMVLEYTVFSKKGDEKQVVKAYVTFQANESVKTGDTSKGWLMLMLAIGATACLALIWNLPIKNKIRH